MLYVHQGVNVKRQGSLGAILEAGMATIMHVYKYKYICVCVYLFVYMVVCVYVYVYVDIHTCIS